MSRQVYVASIDVDVQAKQASKHFWKKRKKKKKKNWRYLDVIYPKTDSCQELASYKLAFSLTTLSWAFFFCVGFADEA